MDDCIYKEETWQVEPLEADERGVKVPFTCEACEVAQADYELTRLERGTWIDPEPALCTTYLCEACFARLTA